jgi:hypothetical protein
MTEDEQCKHEYGHLNTYFQREDYPAGTAWVRRDEFYCKKCLKIEAITKKHESRWKPEWWRG